MKILILSQYFWPESFRINEVAATLKEQGAEVEVLSAKPNYPQGKIYPGYRAWGCQREFFKGIPVHRVPVFPRGSGGLRLALNYFSFVLAGLVFAPWMLRRKRFDVIFVYGVSPILQAIPAIFLARIKKCPVVLWVQDLWPESLSATGYVENSFLLKLVERMVRLIYQNCDLLLVQSRGFEEPVRRLASGTRVVYYPNSVDEAFGNPVTGDTPGIEGLNGGFSVLFAGNIGSAQAVEVIVEAADLLKDYGDIHFVVVGDGSCRSEMLRSAFDRGLKNLHLPGRFPVEMMPALMQSASVLLVTLSDKPIFSLTVPNKVQAYLASGKPIIACLNGEGARIIAEAEAGLTVRAENSQELAAAVLSLYGMNMSDRAQLGLNGRNYFRKHFDHAKLVAELMAHFEAISGNGDGPL